MQLSHDQVLLQAAVGNGEVLSQGVNGKVQSIVGNVASFCRLRIDTPITCYTRESASEKPQAKL